MSARTVSKQLQIKLEFDPRSDLAFLGTIPLDYETAVGDQRFVQVDALQSIGARLAARKDEIVIKLNGREIAVHAGPKRAVVDKARQRLSVFQGGALVFTTRVSTGKYSRSTPDGMFKIGRVKDAYHASSKYGDSPMPWAVHVTRNIYIHGGIVPDHPVSHGCVRLPDEAAKWFYNWVEPGTILRIQG